MEKDCPEWKLTTIDPQERAPGDQVWDLLCVQLASYLEGGPANVDDAPAHLSKIWL